MKVLEARFLRGPNVYRMSPCFAVLLDLQTQEPDAALAAPITTADVAQWLARSMIALQASVGGAVTFCHTERLAPAEAEHHRLVCDYEHEAVATESLNIALHYVAALAARRPFDMAAGLARLQALADARAVPPATQAWLDAARFRGIPVSRLEDGGPHYTLGWGIHQRQHSAVLTADASTCIEASLDTMFRPGTQGRIPVIAVTGTNGKTTTTQLISHVLRCSGARAGAATSQGVFIDGLCVERGDCSGYWSARRVLGDRSVEVAALETARGGILKRGLGFDHCDVGVVLNVSADHLGLDGVQTLEDLAHVKGLVARCARSAAVLNADDALCVAMRDTLPDGCRPVLFTLDAARPVFADHLQAGGSGACLDADGWLVWCSPAGRTKVVLAAELPFTWHGCARHNTANALAALAALRSLDYEPAAIARGLASFQSDAHSNPLRGNRFQVGGVSLIVDYAHNVAACQALCEAARSMVHGSARLLGVVTSPGDRRAEDLFRTGHVCGQGFDELYVYEMNPRGRAAGVTSAALLQGARSAAPGKPLHGEPGIRQALARGLNAARAGDVLVFTCAGTLDDVVEGVRLANPAAADRMALEVLPVAAGQPSNGPL